MRKRLATGLALAGALALSACFRLIPSSEAPGPAVPAPRPGIIENAAMAGIVRGPSVGSLNLTPGDAATALASFIESCPQLIAREDASGLTRGEDWRVPCSSAGTWPQGEAREFFKAHFETARVGDGAAFATGYFEPEIAGCRIRRPGCEVPIYGLPPDLVRDWPADVPEAERTGRAPLGRVDAAGGFIPYYTRAEIEDGALAGRGLEIAWAADPVEFFFLQIQGSGRVRTADGEVIRIGYAGQNGREYVGVGRVMRERGLIGEEPGQYPGSMQGIMRYMREHPDESRELMRLNLSWVFFRQIDGANDPGGPLGALGVPVRRESSAAVDPRFVPLGAPVWLDLDRNEADGLWIAQDTGGAIKGANRIDTFWGAGKDSPDIAGGMNARGEALILLPKGTIARIGRR